MERRPCRRKKKKRKKTCTYDLDQPKRWHMQRRKRASSPVASVASWFDHHHHHWPHHQKAPSLPPALTTTRCYPPSVSFPIVVVVVFEKTFSPPSHVPRHYSPEISTICVSALRPISLRDPHRFAGEGEEESHLLREANCDLDDFLRPGGGWMGWKQLMLFEEERWEDGFAWNRSNNIAYYYFPSCLLCTLFLSVLSICFRFYKR